MPTPYTGNPSNFSDIVDLPDDTDPPDSADINTPFEALIDDVAALANAYRNELANIAALQAVVTTGLATGATRYVVGLGRFVLDKTTNPTWPQDLPVVVQPTTGTGRWFATDAEAIQGWTKTFTAVGDTAFVVPPMIDVVAYELWGGGGGGGGGASGDATTTSNAPGGAGGGAGSRRNGISLSGLAGASLTAHVGAGGAGGATGGGLGADGASSYVTPGLGAVCIAPGGQGGTGSIASGGVVLIPGGVCDFAGNQAMAPCQVTGLTQWPMRTGDGGYCHNAAGTATRAGIVGGGSCEGFNGGAAGAAGTSGSTHAGGSGGSGGGGGPSGAGGDGGAAGNGNDSGAGTAGAAGVAALVANSGAGGGGGGGGGCGSASGGAGGVGAAGAAGKIRIRGYAS